MNKLIEESTEKVITFTFSKFAPHGETDFSYGEIFYKYDAILSDIQIEENVSVFVKTLDIPVTCLEELDIICEALGDLSQLEVYSRLTFLIHFQGLLLGIPNFPREIKCNHYIRFNFTYSPKEIKDK